MKLIASDSSASFLCLKHNLEWLIISVFFQEGSPFIVCMTYAFQTPEKLCFILDLMNGGDLHYHLSQHGVFSEKEVRFYAAEVILGLEHMHNRYVVYRDLKVRLYLTSDPLLYFPTNHLHRCLIYFSACEYFIRWKWSCTYFRPGFGLWFLKEKATRKRVSSLLPYFMDSQLYCHHVVCIMNLSPVLLCPLQRNARLHGARGAVQRHSLWFQCWLVLTGLYVV